MLNKIFLPLTLAFLVGGCSMAPDLQVPAQELPAAAEESNATTAAIDIRWWQQFDDARLDGLIDEALKNSDDLKLAASNVALARAALGFSQADRYPTLDADASAYRQKTSNESLSPFSGVIYNTFGIGATAGYEFDFWGKYKDAEAAARAQLLATKADRETVRISLVSSVAELYVNLVALNLQIGVTEQSVKAFKESYEYRQRQFRFGAINELTVEQSHTLYANAKLALEALREAKTTSESALAVLIGRSPKALFEERLATETALPAAITIPSGITSRLLEQRPDIRAAQERLKAANASIGVARSAYFPSISLTGTVGLQSIELGNLMQSSAKTWGFGPALNVPVFDFGRIASNVESAEVQKESAVIDYAKTVKGAFKEVYDALHKIEYTKTKLAAQQEGAEAYEKVMTLSQQRFDTGYGDYLDVLVAKRGLLDAQLNLIALNAELLANQITLYKALGGGWK